MKSQIRQIRWFKIVDPDELIPGLWKSTNNSDSQVKASLLAFQKVGFIVTEIDAGEARRIRRQQTRADNQSAREV